MHRENIRFRDAYIYVLAIIVLLVFGSPSALASVHGKHGKTISWSLDNDGVLTIEGEGAIEGFSRRNMPWRPDFVRKVVVKEGVTKIGKNSFNGCKNLQYVTLPSTLERIDKEAFANCRGLIAVNLPEGLQTIEDRAFYACRNIAHVVFPQNLKMIGAEAFRNCSSLFGINLPEGITDIGANAFSGCPINDIQGLPDIIQPWGSEKFGLQYYAVQKFRESEAARQKQMADTELAKRQAEERMFEEKHTAVVSDVDIDLPAKPQNNENKFAFIISNENYQHLAAVPYAHSDGSTFASYCRKLLAMPNNNVRHYKNATYLNLKSVIDEIRRVDAAYEGAADFVIYYAGHGVPDEKTLNAYLVPSDAMQANAASGMSLADFYDALGALQSKSVVVFLDACFSGATRDYAMLNEGERAVVIKPRHNTLSGNVVVLSAAAGDQTAQPLADKGHGLFTYYLLKVLKDSNGEATMGEIKNYVRQNVKRASTSAKLKDQTPSANVSAAVADIWEDWQLDR